MKRVSSWKVERLGDVCEIDKIPHRKNNLPYVGLEHIESSSGKFIGSLEPLKVKSQTFNFSEKHVLYGRLRPYLKKVLLPDFEGHCSTEIFPLKVSDRLDRKFLFHWLLSDETTNRINATSTGARMPRANMNQVLDFEIPIPPLPEQQRIVSLLDKTFAALTKVHANAERNQVNAREVFEAELNVIFENGKNWESKTLRDISIEFGRGKSKNRPRNDPKLYGGKYPFVQTGDIRNSNHYITEYTQTYNEVGLAQSKLWKKGTICITIAANIAETGILGFDACFPDSVIGLVVNPKIADADFAEYMLQYFRKRLQAKGKGSAQDNLNMQKFENEYFPIPPLAEQRAIVQRLDGLAKETRRLEEVYEKKVEDVEELRKSVLSKAFNGDL